MDRIEEIRAKIGECDDIIIEQLAVRMSHIQEIISYKKATGIPILQKLGCDRGFHCVDCSVSADIRPLHVRTASALPILHRHHRRMRLHLRGVLRVGKAVVGE